MIQSRSPWVLISAASSSIFFPLLFLNQFLRLLISIIFMSCQGIAKSLHKDCVRRMEPSKVGFFALISIQFLFPFCIHHCSSSTSLNYNISLPWSFTLLLISLQCIFPREIIKNVRTPLFIVNPAYDFWQVTCSNRSILLVI